VRQKLGPGRVTLVSLACGVLLAACGGGSSSGGSGEGRLQVIEFNYPGGGTLLGAPRTLKATSSSGLTVSFRSETPTYCTVSGDKVTLVAAGECRIVASQEGGTTTDGVKWARADEVSHLFNVLKAPQTLQIDAPDYVLSGQTNQLTLSAVSTSGLAATFAGGTPGVCTLNGNKLTLLGKGSCAVTATQEGDANYAAVKVDRFIAVDPLLVADGILGAGEGSTSSARTKQNGAVTANPWSSLLNAGWEWCGPNPNCFRAVSPDERTFTSALHVPTSSYSAGQWNASFNNIDIFVPGVEGFNQDGDTVGGLQVTTETSIALTVGVNEELYKAGKPLVLQLDLGKRNDGCNPTLSAILWPFAPGPVGYRVVLDQFAVTQACGLAGVTAASLDDDVRKLPNYWGNGPTDTVAQQAYLAALDKIKPARDSAMTLLKSSSVVRVRVRLMDINLGVSSPGGYYASDVSITGAIAIQ